MGWNCVRKIRLRPYVSHSWWIIILQTWGNCSFYFSYFPLACYATLDSMWLHHTCEAVLDVTRSNVTPLGMAQQWTRRLEKWIFLVDLWLETTPDRTDWSGSKLSAQWAAQSQVSTCISVNRFLKEQWNTKHTENLWTPGFDLWAFCLAAFTYWGIQSKIKCDYANPLHRRKQSGEEACGFTE